MISAVLSAVVLFGQAAPATVTPPGAPAAAAQGDKAVSGVTVTGKKPLSNDQQAKVLVCHDEPVLGSLFPKHICATRQAMDQRKRDDQEVARDFQRSVIAGPQPQ